MKPPPGIVAERERLGRAVDGLAAQVASTCAARGATVAPQRP